MSFRAVTETASKASLTLQAHPYGLRVNGVDTQTHLDAVPDEDDGDFVWSPLSQNFDPVHVALTVLGLHHLADRTLELASVSLSIGGNRVTTSMQVEAVPSSDIQCNASATGTLRATPAVAHAAETA